MSHTIGIEYLVVFQYVVVVPVVTCCFPSLLVVLPLSFLLESCVAFVGSLALKDEWEQARRHRKEETAGTRFPSRSLQRSYTAAVAS
jgi:hypothetical protein